MTTLRASCSCTSAVLLRAGEVVCATCGAPIVDEHPVTAPDEVSTVRLPLDVRNAEIFNRACRAGRVKNARKVGRVWICSRADWDARSPARAPELRDGSKERSRTKKKAAERADARPAPSARADVLRELGIARRTG